MLAYVLLNYRKFSNPVFTALVLSNQCRIDTIPYGLSKVVRNFIDLNYIIDSFKN